VHWPRPVPREIVDGMTTTSTDITVDVRGLRRRYGGRRAGQGFDAVRGIDLQVRRGELYALLGTNGAGKTSSLEVIEGLVRPTAGTVRLLGHDPCSDRAQVRPRIGIMLQEAGFPGALTVSELARTWHDLLIDPRPVGEVLEQVGLAHRSRVAIESLSGGEQRRLDLALAVMGRPEVIFLDEPTTGLDPQSRRTTWELIRGLLAEQTSVVLTTHYLEEAEVLADRIGIMHAGRIAREGTLSAIVQQQPSQISFGIDDGVDVTGVATFAGAGFHLTETPSRREVRLETFDTQRVLRLLLSWAGDDIDLRGLRVVPGSLEQAFLEVAASDPDVAFDAQEMIA
jgi:ABC-2 type transport system ATP-binding protein